MRLRRTEADRQTAGSGWGGLARLGAVLVAAVVLQTAVAPHFRLWGAYPDFALLAVVAVALLLGPEAGAVFGFLAGMLGGIALMEPFGLSAFVLVLVGHLAGRYAESTDPGSGYVPLVTVVAATFVSQALFATAQFLLSREVPLGFFFGQVLLPSLLLEALLAVPSYLAVRAALRGAGEESRVARLAR